MKRVYCDSVILIYFLDHVGQFNVQARSHLAAIRAAGDKIIISDLVRLEYRVAPLFLKDAAKLTAFDQFCQLPEIEFVPLNRAVYDLASEIRAAEKFRLGDSLHLATAVHGGCDSFLTNDRRLSKFAGIPVHSLA